MPIEILRYGYVPDSGGGGRGYPLDREPARVLADVLQGYVSDSSAREEYGVVVDRDEVDGAATVALREKLHAMSPREPPFFDYGPERTAYETTWSTQAYDELMSILYALPVHWRLFVKHRIVAAVEASPDRHGNAAAGVRAAFAELAEAYPVLQPS